MGVLEQYVAVGQESNYGAAVAQTRAYEAMTDNFEREIQYVESMGFRKGIRAERADRYTAVTLGASGSLEMAWLTSGMGLLLHDILGGGTGPTPVGSNFALTMVADGRGPTSSHTIRTGRSTGPTTVEEFVYAGCFPVGFTISASVDEPLKIMVDYSAQSETAGGAAQSTLAYAAGAPFTWDQISGMVNGTSMVTLMSFELSVSLGMTDDLRYLKGEANRTQPVRNSIPTFEGSIEAHYTPNLKRDIYDRFHNNQNTAVSLRAEANSNTSVVLSLPAVKFDSPSTPSMSRDDLTTISAPFMGLEAGTAPLTITITNQDSAL